MSPESNGDEDQHLGVLDKPVDDEATVIPWTIDNKYYTAQVEFLLVELDHDGDIPADVDVLIYVFERVSVYRAVQCSS